MSRAPRRDPGLSAEFGRRIRRQRERLGFSQEALADEAGVHRTYIGHIERGETSPTLFNIVRLATALQTDPGLFLMGLTLERSE